MKYPFSHIKIKTIENASLSSEEFVKKRRGEILHLTLSFVTYKEEEKELFSFLKKALSFYGETESNWNLEKDFLQPLKKLFSLEECEKFFPSLKKRMCLFVKVLKEKTFFAGGKFFRPDRIILYPEKIIVVDFKSYLPTQEHFQELYKAQVEGYSRIVSKIYKKPAEGYLLFLEPLSFQKIITVSE